MTVEKTESVGPGLELFLVKDGERMGYCDTEGYNFILTARVCPAIWPHPLYCRVQIFDVVNSVLETTVIHHLG